MATFDVMLSLGLTEQDLFECLSIADLAHLEGAAQFTRSHLRMHPTWFQALENELPMFDVSVGFKSQALPKHVIASLVAGLRGVAVCGGARVPIKDFQQANALIAAVRRARNTASTHIAAGGCAAEVTVGMIKFSCMNERTDPTDRVTSDALTLSLDWRSSATAAVSDEHPSQLEVAISKTGSSFLLEITNPWTTADGANEHVVDPWLSGAGFFNARGCLFVDASAISSSVKLSLTDVTVRRDGSCSMGMGLSTTIGKPSAVAAGLVQGFPCVFGMRDATVPSIASVSLGVHALHIDARR